MPSKKATEDILYDNMEFGLEVNPEKCSCPATRL
jgi:hypothetical protein